MNENAVEITAERYEKLVAAETELKLLKAAILNAGSYDLDSIKRLFGIKKVEE